MILVKNGKTISLDGEITIEAFMSDGWVEANETPQEATAPTIKPEKKVAKKSK